MAQNKLSGVRPGLKDLWGADLVSGASWSDLDNPVNPNVATRRANAIISLHDAKTLHRRKMAEGDSGYRVSAHVHLYIDDSKFDGEREGVWRKHDAFLDMLRHFDGALGIDFSTYLDFPSPLKGWQVCRIRMMEYFLSSHGVEVIQNARWAEPDSWERFFDVLHHGAPLSLGTVASGLKYMENRPLFEMGLLKLVEVCSPSVLYVVGSANLAVFDEVRGAGVEVVQFDGPTAAAFAREGAHHE